MLNKKIAALLIAMVALLYCFPSDARFPRGGGGASAFNGKRIQTNVNSIQQGGDFPWLNVLKSAQDFAFVNLANAPVTPDMLDSDGYLISSAGNAASGIYTTYFIPSQQQKPGAYIIRSIGDGTVTSGNTNATAVTYTITSLSQSGGVQTVNLSSSPIEMRAGQPIAISNITSGGTWTSFNASWRVLDVNIAGNSFRVDTATTYTGTPTVSGTTKATFTTSTSVGNVGGGLNGSGRYAFQPTATIGGGNGTQAYMAITSIASSVNYPHSISVVHVNDEAALDAGEEFTAKFKTTAAYFGVHRFLNWQYGVKQNVSNVTTWNTRKARSYVSYASGDYRSTLYAGATSGLSGRTYTASAPSINSSTGAAWAGLTDKATIHVLFAQGTWQTYPAVFTNGNPDIAITGHTYVNGDQVAFFTFGGAIPSNITASQYYFVCSASAGVSIRISTNVGCTGIITPNAGGSGPESTGALFMNIGGTGAKKILPVFVNPFINNQWPESGNYKSLATLVYDVTLDAYIMYGGNADFGSQGIINGVPYESELALCTTIGAHPWWVTPVLAADPVTDFMPSLMQYTKLNKPAWMIPRFEPPNELWNGGFPQTAYANAKAAAYGWGSDFYNWYGKALSTLGQSAGQVFGSANRGTTYHILGGVQTGFAVTGDRNNSLPKFNSAKYIADGVAQSSLSGSWGTINFSASVGTAEAYRWTSHLAVATYMTPSVYYAADGPQTRTGLASAYSGSQFTATIAAGTMTVASVDKGAALAIGMTVLGPNVPSGVTITGGSAPNWTLSNSGFSISYSQSYTAGVDLTAPVAEADSLVDTQVNATITGSNFVINSLVSGSTAPTGLYVYGGTIAFGSGVVISGGTYPNYTLNSSPGNQTATFKIGITYSLTGAAQLYSSWASWMSSNFGIARIAAYEGGYSPDYGVLGNSFDLMSAQSKHAASMQTYTTTNFNNFLAVTGAEFPSIFNMTGIYPSGLAWSVLEDIYESPDPPQWTAIKNY